MSISHTVGRDPLLYYTRVSCLFTRLYHEEFLTGYFNGWTVSQPSRDTEVMTNPDHTFNVCWREDGDVRDGDVVGRTY